MYNLYDDYDALFHAGANNCSEAIFELQLRNDTERAWSQASMTYTFRGWRTDQLTLTGDAADEIGIGTYGFMSPRESLYEAFVAVEGVDGYRLRNTIRTYEQMVDYGVSLATGGSMIGNEGYFCWKTRTEKSDCVIDYSSLQMLQYINYRIMRYAEVLLMAAEAHFQSGNSSKAMEYVNMIRDRAQVDRLTSITLEDIKTEKRLELCYEGCRYQDLIRWGDAETYLGEQGASIPEFGYIVQTDSNGEPLVDGEGNYVYELGVHWPYTNTTYGFQEKHKLLPIPLTEIEVNPNMQQNPGW